MVVQWHVAVNYHFTTAVPDVIAIIMVIWCYKRLFSAIFYCKFVSSISTAYLNIPSQRPPTVIVCLNSLLFDFFYILIPIIVCTCMYYIVYHVHVYGFHVLQPNLLLHCKKRRQQKWKITRSVETFLGSTWRIMRGVEITGL